MLGKMCNVIINHKSVYINLLLFFYVSKDRLEFTG